jgi:hypothetical protein
LIKGRDKDNKKEEKKWEATYKSEVFLSASAASDHRLVLLTHLTIHRLHLVFAKAKNPGLYLQH